jgi:hypothetical protein
VRAPVDTAGGALMAGSYKHCVADDGQLYIPEQLDQMIENGGDVYEAVEEMYGMIWHLATQLAELRNVPAAVFVDLANQHYEDGIARSPGTRGRWSAGNDD